VSEDRYSIRRRRWLYHSLRYLLALTSVAAVLLLQRWIEPILGQSLSALLFAAVMITAWFGGLGPALLATTIAAYFSAFPLVTYPESPGFGWDDSARTIVFFMVAVFISSLTAMRRRAEAALQQSYEELEIRIEQRTRELRESNQLLRESEERFRLLVEGVADYAIVTLGSTGDIVSWNPGAERIHGFTSEQAIGQNAKEFYLPEDIVRQKPTTDLRRALEQGRYEDEGWRVRQDGTKFWANVITTALQDEAGRPRGFAQVTRDVTELRSLEKQLLEISDRQQMRIGHDLHDGIGQELTGIALLTQNLRQRLLQSNAVESAEAARIAGLANRVLEQTRQLARGLAAVDLGPEGLETALDDLAAKVHISLGRPCTVAVSGSLQLADDAVAMHLYRIAQEATNNAARHAKAQHIRIELNTGPEAVVLSIHDDGIGVRPKNGVHKGMGMHVMQYRARMIGASLEIRSNAGGTSVICSYPIQVNDESNAIDAKKAAAQPG
jgi:PAS domain S-box-containing protein